MKTAILSLTLLLLALCQTAQAQQTDTLDIRQQNIVLIASATARGDLNNLKTSLSRGCSLRALQTFMEVLDSRKAQGITDTVGREASAITDKREKYTRGAELLEKLSGAPADAPKTGYAAFAPIIEQYLKEHLFCDIFERDLLTWQERELATVSILTAMGEGVEPMLKSHSAICLRQGITEGQLRQMTTLVNGLDDDPVQEEPGTEQPENPNNPDNPDDSDNPDDPDTPTGTGNILVAYGNTQYVAEQIAKQTGGTLFRIEPVKPYPTEYTPCTEVAKRKGRQRPPRHQGESEGLGQLRHGVYRLPRLVVDCPDDYQHLCREL